MTIMYDSVDVTAIPSDAVVVAGYVDGAYNNLDAIKTRFPGAEWVGITVTGLAGAKVADCERGDLSPTDAVNWAASELAAGRSPCIYTSRSVFEGDVAFSSFRVTGPNGWEVALNASVDFWIADWTGQDHLYLGSVATQWASLPGFDISTTNGSWPLEPAPPPVVVPSTPPAAPSIPSSSAPTTGGLPTVQSGATGPYVVDVQAVISVKSPLRLLPDGQFGTLTDSAVRTWQQERGLTVDGIVGPLTWASLLGA
jgi:peptidoglycan hydrolase-like protein with peptidoglycan-binding domain